MNNKSTVMVFCIDSNISKDVVQFMTEYLRYTEVNLYTVKDIIKNNIENKMVAITEENLAMVLGKVDSVDDVEFIVIPINQQNYLTERIVSGMSIEDIIKSKDVVSENMKLIKDKFGNNIKYSSITNSDNPAVNAISVIKTMK